MQFKSSAMSKKFCDGETQISGTIIFSWSYPKVLNHPPKEVEYGYNSVRIDKWTQTIPQDTFDNQISKFKKRVKAQAGEKRIKSSGIHAIKTPSPEEIINVKFPVGKIERTRGHSFDDGAMIFGGRKILPQVRLRYKPHLEVTSRVINGASQNLYNPIIEDLNREILRVNHELKVL